MENGDILGSKRQRVSVPQFQAICLLLKHITTLTQVFLEEVIQNEVNGIKGSHRPIILNNALSKTINLRARYILRETTKNKKWTTTEMIPFLYEG